MLAAQREVELRHELLERLAQARARTDQLFGFVRQDSLYERPIAERHRIVFYIGHLEAFDWNLLRDRVLSVNALHPEYDRLFAFGIDPVGGGLPADQPQDWPSLADIRDYVARARRTLDHSLQAQLSDISTPARQEFPVSLLLQVAIEHRLMHAETLAYMLHQLPLDRKVQPQLRPELVTRSATPRMIEIPAGRVTLGLRRDEPDSFGWDNEYEQHTPDVPAFAIDKYKVTNAQYLDFITAGGYENRDFWTRDGWNWKTEHNVAHPGFWRRRGYAWHVRTMFDEVPLPLDWPVYVSQAEASAYARWAGKTLPTETQWQHAAYGSREGEERSYPWGQEAPSSRRGNFDFQRWDPTPVGAFPEGQSNFGVTDLLGNGWEWTSTLFGPFPGFEPFPFYRGYSADFFDNQHFVMKGGSARTAACMLRRSFRNWFQPHYPHVYAGFRCVSH
ncbi:MAG TPA: SUMF1/EgtB/PvdO family nonheme iron enzyme [Terriglobales bacterium]|nr:SUMF1/EgtB/PvdO family nonheme iron enzyme [Terriglobales bacterium]